MSKNAVEDQEKIRQQLVAKAIHTSFGKDHNFEKIKTHKDFIQNIPIRGYEELKPYVEKIIDGQKDVLWPGMPKYFGKTSGTTSGAKYIPITKDSIPFHIKTARNAILNYIAQTKQSLFSHNLIFISGSPELSLMGKIKTGRLSGIVNHEIPGWVKPNQIPTYKTNCIDDWEEKLDAIVEESLNSDLSLISGIPPWVQMYYERLLAKSGKKTIKELFPNFQLFIHGGVNYTPYKSSLEKLVGPGVNTLETYPASEGFIAFQDDYKDESLLLNSDAGMFFEFVPAGEIFEDNPTRLSIGQIKTGIDYAIIINSNAGLWGYNIGDTVRFSNLNPFKLKVSGRIKHFISAFGEHVIAKEVEEAMDVISKKHNIQVTEFTVAPQIHPPEGGLPYHEWLVEFDEVPENLDIIAHQLDEEIVRQNIYYRDLVIGNVLQTLKIKPLKQGAFRNYMKSLGKLGGQNKVARLTNDRNIADKLIKDIQ
jgi:hypothetical protein